MPPLCEHTIDTLSSQLASWGFPTSHAAKILRHFYRTGGDLDGIAGRIGPRLLGLLKELVPPIGSRVARRHVSEDGTIKLLVEFPAGGAAEAVLMPSHRDGRAAACVSSQVGCAMGCAFCASTKDGLERSLCATEVVEQFLHLAAEANSSGRRIASLVFMGMGEPLSNYEAVVAAIRKIADPDLGGVGWRQVTVSTVGIVPGIDRLADEDLNVHLALSLHAADDELRTKLVPPNKKYPITAIIDAARRFQSKTGRVVTIEWCLMAGVNDDESQAEKLAALLHDFRAHVNVIPYNPIDAASFQRPSRDGVLRFIESLHSRGVVCHERQVRGDEIAAACGQLRRQSASL